MKRILILFISLFVIIGINAQVSGYMGTKFSVLYSPSISIPHISSLSSKPIRLKPSISHAIKLEYVITNSSSIGLKYKLSMNNGLNNTEYQTITGFTKRHIFTSHSFGSYIKFYRSRNLAPLGRYIAIGANFQKLSLNNFMIEEYSTLTGNQVISSVDYSRFDFNITWAVGNNWVIFDRILLGFEFESAFPVASAYKSTTSYRNNNSINRFNLSTEILKLTLNVGALVF